MLTTLDTTRLILRQQQHAGNNNAQNPGGSPHEGPVFTIPEIMDILEDRPELREEFRQALIELIRKKELIKKDEEQQNDAPHQA